MSLVTRLRKNTLQKDGHQKVKYEEDIWEDKELPKALRYLQQAADRGDVQEVELWLRDDGDEDSVLVFRGEYPLPLGESIWSRNLI